MAIIKPDIILLASLFISNGVWLMKNTRRIQVIMFFVLFLPVFAGCTPVQYEPEDGVWFCEELQIQLSYEQDAQSFVIRDGEQIICACGSDRGVPYIYVSCQETNNSIYSLGEEIFYAKIIELSETELLVCDEETMRQYTFTRLE